MPDQLRGSVGIFGGSFNPVHNAHLRMAIEVREMLGLQRVDFVPAMMPPHKGTRGMLPFGMRLDMLRLATGGVSGLGVDALEGDMPGPSYTYSTLTALTARNQDTNYAFMLGSTDMVTLPLWHHGLELPLLADLIVVDRLGLGRDTLEAFISAHWEWQREDLDVLRIVGGRRVILLTMPRLDVSASLVRERFMLHRDVAGLVPESVGSYLRRNADAVRGYWNM